MRKNEDPCAQTEEPCRYIVEEDHDSEGLLVSWDLQCADCGKYREWQKGLCEKDVNSTTSA